MKSFLFQKLLCISHAGTICIKNRLLLPQKLEENTNGCIEPLESMVTAVAEMTQTVNDKMCVTAMALIVLIQSRLSRVLTYVTLNTCARHLHYLYLDCACSIIMANGANL